MKPTAKSAQVNNSSVSKETKMAVWKEILHMNCPYFLNSLHILNVLMFESHWREWLSLRLSKLSLQPKFLAAPWIFLLSIFITKAVRTSICHICSKQINCILLYICLVACKNTRKHDRNMQKRIIWHLCTKRYSNRFAGLPLLEPHHLNMNQQQVFHNVSPNDYISCHFLENH